MPLVSIPTNKPTQRIDYPDNIYANIEMVKKLHAKGQPVLLISGTVEITHIYSKMLLQDGIPHSTRPANNVANEALIIH
ncbi:hypothetical protein ACJBQX_10275, partial [Streptococcus suis]